jgi:hypothetical protein
MAENAPIESQPSSTPPAAPAPAAVVEPPKSGDDGTGDETVTISKKELDGLKKSQKDFQSAADKAKNDAAASGDFVLQLAKEREIDSYLDTNKEKFSYVTRDDLMHLDDPGELEAEATRLQKRFQDVVQDALMNVGKAKPPELSPEDKAKALKDIKKNKPADGFQRMLALQEPNQ